MAVWSIVTKAALSSDFRLDAEYYRPEALALRCAIEQSRYPAKRLEGLAYSIINFGAYSLCNDIVFESSGVRFITAENIHDGYVDFIECRHISPEQHSRLLWKSQVSNGQVLVSMAARLGYAAVYDGLQPLNSSQDIAKITLADKEATQPFYVAAFINSRLGREQLLAARTGSVQQHTNLGRIKDLQIVIPPPAIQKPIADTFKLALSAREKSLDSLAESEALLESALGLDKLDLTPRLFYERPYAAVHAAARFDAEYFQPPKKAILDALEKMPGQAVGDQFRSVRQLWHPDTAGASEQVRNYDLTDALQLFLDETVEPATRDTIASTKKKLKPGDLVVSRLRSYLKEIAVVLDTGPIPMVGSTEFIVLRPQKGAVHAEALLVYLRSKYVQTVWKWCQDGSNHPRFDERELLGLRVPDVVRDRQDEIAAKVQASIHARREARRLLDRAKAMVEEAILGAKGS